MGPCLYMFCISQRNRGQTLSICYYIYIGIHIITCTTKDIGKGAVHRRKTYYYDIVFQMSSNEHSFVKTESTCGVYEVILDSFSPPNLRTGFLAAAKSLENQTPGKWAFINDVTRFCTCVTETCLVLKQDFMQIQ